MENKVLKNKVFCMACLVVMLFVIVLFTGAPALAYADSSMDSSVLDDLRRDENFDVGLYPSRVDDYSLEVIQIAESTGNELLVYVYQPSGAKGGLFASSLNLSVQEDLKDMHNYKLKLINSSGVFYKYLVEDFKVSKEELRFYYVPSIYRRFIEGVDKEADRVFENSIPEVVYPVKRQYKFTTVDNVVYCEALALKTIEVTDKIVGYVRYNDGFKFYTAGSCDSHFVAFNTDIPMDKILEADVEFVSQSVHVTTLTSDGKTTVTRGELKSEKKPLSCDDKVVYNGGGLFAKTFKFERIETMDDFIEGTEKLGTLCYGASEISKDKLKELKKLSWVLRFYETKNSFSSGIGSYISDTTSVNDVSILRLKFVYEDDIYNLGVIDNKQSGGNNPINDPKGSSWLDKLLDAIDKFFKWLSDHFGLPSWVWIAVLCIIMLAIFLPILSVVFPAFGEVLKMIVKGIGIGLKWLFKGLWWLICLPFKGIKALIEKIKEK